MAAFLTEDDIEQAMVQRLQYLHGFDSLTCYTTDPADLNDNSGRTDKRDVILHDRLEEAAVALNDGIPESVIAAALDRLGDKRRAMSPVAANREIDALIRDGIDVEFEDEKGKVQREKVRGI